MPEAEAKVDGRSLRYRDRRRELLLGSIDYVLENGIADLSMRPLAKALGITHTSLSAHFGSKENLITEIIATIRQMGSRRQTLKSPPRDEGEFADFEAYDLWWRKFTQDRFLPAIQLSFEVLGIALRDRERYDDFLKHLITDWLDLYVPLLRACGCPEDELDTTATSAIAHMVGLQADLLVTGDRDRVNRAHEQFLAGLEARRQGWIAAAAATSAS